MSSTAFRVAEVEARLCLLRRRINAFRAQHVAYLGASGIVAIVVMLIVAGLQAPAEVFRVATWLGIAVIVAVATASLLLVASRWVDDDHAARLADREGGLADRLTTLISLRARPQPSRLQPVLIAQTLDLGDRWRPERIAPRRIPRSIFVLFASLLLLASTVFLEKRGLDIPGLSPEKNDAIDFEKDAPAKLPSSPPHQPRTRGDQPEDSLDALGGPDPRGSGELAEALEGLPQGGTYDGSAPLEGTQLSQLPDRLQDAIRRAFDAEPLDSLRHLGSGAERATSGRAAEGRKGGIGEEGEEGSVEPGSGQRQARGEASHPSAQEPRQQRGERGEAQKVGQRRDMKHGKPGELSGSSPGAGDGAGSVPPIGTEPDLGVAAMAAAPFKLTITSFLAAVERQGQPQWKAGAGAPAADGGGEATGTLSDHQLKDDALRKAEIPAEYEDVVRRAYSAGK